MNRHKFWDKVAAYFWKETGSDRTMNSIISKWKTRIRCQVTNFGAIVDNVKGTHGSGENDLDNMSKALIEYSARYGQDFTMLECWKVLRGHDSWKEEIPLFQSGVRKKVKGSTTTSGSTQGPSNFQDLDDDDEETEDDNRESRPEGRDRARRKSSTSSHGTSKSFMSGLIAEVWKSRPGKKKKGKERDDSWKQIKERELAIKQKKLEYTEKLLQCQEEQKELLRTTKRDQELIFYNSAIDPNLPERQREELMRMKADIKARHNLNY